MVTTLLKLGSVISGNSAHKNSKSSMLLSSLDSQWQGFVTGVAEISEKTEDVLLSTGNSSIV